MMKLSAKVSILGRVRLDGQGRPIQEPNPHYPHEWVSLYENFEQWGLGIPGSRQTPPSRDSDNDEKWRSQVRRTELFRTRVQEIFDRQEDEPVWLDQYRCVWQGKIYGLHESEGLDWEEKTLLVRQYALSLSQHFKSIERQIKAFENLDRLIHRDPIPQSVRLYVWQRDGGKCVECGRRDGLEFDHIIPVSEGGSSTERNIQLLCLRCNRSKGAKV